MFENATLYTQYLSNVNRPIPIEHILMGALFHNYKTLLKLNRESKLSEDSILQEVAILEREIPLSKTLFDKTCERWHGLLYALHKDDREQILSMLVDCCYDNLDDGAGKMLSDKASISNISILFFVCLVLQNQKLINEIKRSSEKNVKTDVNLLDFID